MSGASVNDVTILAAGGAKGTAIELIGFAVVLLVLLRWIVPLVGRAMKARQETIAAQLAASEAAAQKLAEAQAAYDNAVADARAEAARLREEAQAQYQAIVDEAASAAQSRADEITARAREQLEAERVQAVRTLQGEIASLTVEQAEQKVRAALSDDARQRRFTERFLDELERTGSGTAPSAAATGEVAR